MKKQPKVEQQSLYNTNEGSKSKTMSKSYKIVYGADVEDGSTLYRHLESGLVVADIVTFGEWLDELEQPKK